MSSQSQCLYRPNRLVHIKLDGPNNTAIKLQLASTTTQQPTSSPLTNNAIRRPKNTRFLNQIRSDAARCGSACVGSHDRGKGSTDCYPKSRFRNWGGNTPFYLTLINQDNSSNKVDPNFTSVTKKSSINGSSNNNNRVKCVMSGRKLQQLINITSLTSLNDDPEDSEDNQRENTKTKNTLAASMPSPTKDPPRKLENRENKHNPNSGALLYAIERRRMDLAVAKLYDCYKSSSASSTSTRSRSRSSSRKSHSPPVDEHLTGVPKTERTEKERWASHRTFAPHPPAQLRKAEARPPAPSQEGDLISSGKTEAQHKAINSRHSRVWESILRRRNPNYTNAAPDIKRCRPNKSPLRIVGNRDTSQEPMRPETNFKPAPNHQDSQSAKTERERSDGPTGVKRESTSRKERESVHSKQELGSGDDLPIQTTAEEHKDSCSPTFAKDKKSAERPRQKSSPNRRLHRPIEKRFQDMQQLIGRESPREIIYPPYFKVEEGESVKRKCMKQPTLSERKGQQKITSTRKTCKTACKFWQSLVDDDKFLEKEDDKPGETKKNPTNNKIDRRQNLVTFPEACANNTGLDVHSPPEEVGHTEVAPAEIHRSCQVKGYEILRRLSRGKFRENISLYLASNESNPKFSPVEIIVVTLPSRSCARSFVETSFSDNSAVMNHQGFAFRQLQTSVLPTHTNLLTRLHVFSSGNCVYQVSNHCSWPTLASLLQPSPQESPPTTRSHNSTPNRYGPATPERHAQFFDSHAYTNSRRTSPDPHRLKAYGKKQEVLSGWEGHAGVVSVGFRVEGKPQERSWPTPHTGAVKLEESASKIIFRQICEGLKHLHDHGLLHSDLNCSNVLVTDKLQVKLTGYGPCNLHTPWELSPGECCDPPLADPYDVYIPPEIMARRSYRGWANSSDIWCLGMTLLHMTLGEVNQQANCAVRLRRSKQFKTICQDNFGYQLGLLLETVLQLKPSHRPCVDTVLEHPWFSDGTDLASEIDRHAQQLTMRTDGRTFPLPKRIREAFSVPSPDDDAGCEESRGDPRVLLDSSQWSCQEGFDTNDNGSGDRGGGRSSGQGDGEETEISSTSGRVLGVTVSPSAGHDDLAPYNKRSLPNTTVAHTSSSDSSHTMASKSDSSHTLSSKSDSSTNTTCLSMLSRASDNEDSFPR